MLKESPAEERRSGRSNGASGNGSPESAEQRNRELVRRWTEGDESAFEGLYQAYAGKIYNFCLRITHNAEDAAEAAQEGFWGFLNSLDGLDLDKVLVSSYIFAAARNAAIKNMRKMRRITLTDDAPDGKEDRKIDIEIDPERSALLDNQRSAVAKANRRLPERQRAVLALRELEGMSYSEIGQAIGVKENAVAQLISRARIRLRAEIRGQSVSLPPKGSACARSLHLLAQRDDGPLTSDDSIWLDAHLAGCKECRVNLAEMEEAGATYRSWLPVPVALAARRSEEAGAAHASKGHIDERTIWGYKITARKTALVALTASTATLIGVALIGGIFNGSSRPASSATDRPAANISWTAPDQATSKEASLTGINPSAKAARDSESTEIPTDESAISVGRTITHRDSAPASSSKSPGKNSERSPGGSGKGKGSKKSSPSPVNSPSTPAPDTPSPLQPAPTTPPADSPDAGSPDEPCVPTASTDCNNIPPIYP